MVAIKSLIIARSEIEQYTGIKLVDTDCSIIELEEQLYFPINISLENITTCYNAMEEAAFEEDAKKLNNSFTLMNKLKKLFPDYNWIMIMNI